jgi:hypothetical protein
MNNLSREFELFKLWPDLPRDMQEKLFETAVPDNPLHEMVVCSSMRRRRSWHQRRGRFSFGGSRSGEEPRMRAVAPFITDGPEQGKVGNRGVKALGRRAR